MKTFEASRVIRWIHRSVLDLKDHQVSWEVEGMEPRGTARVEEAWTVV